MSENYVCINCLHPTESLYKKYSAEVIRLTECSNCHEIVDKYVEYDVALTVVDLIIHYSHAYRHIIYNMPGKNFLRLLVLFVFCDAYDKWITERAGQSTEANRIYDLELIFYKSLAHSATEFAAYFAVILFFETTLHRSTKRARFVLESSILGYYGNVAVVLSIIFKLSGEPFYQLATRLFLWVTHIQIQRALFPEIGLITNIAVVTAASTASLTAGKLVHELMG